MMIMQETSERLVMPGDRLGVEEEYTASDNTFVDESDGTIRSAIVGNVSIKEGKISVHSNVSEKKRYTRGMFVVGTVTDDVKAVMFVKLDKIEVKGVEWLAIKDGKIIMPRPMRGPPRGMRDRNEEEKPQREESKPCSVGDVIIAKILYEDPEIYTLSLHEPETGVVLSNCELCDSPLTPMGPHMLECKACSHKADKKVSTLYGKPEAIKSLYA